MMGDSFADRARALVGTRFRAQGRDAASGLDCIGLVAEVFGVVRDLVPRDYRLRGGDVVRLKRELDRHFRRIGRKSPRAGDVLLFAVAADQLHLGILTPVGFVHADAGLRRVVETPDAAPWPVLSVYRFRNSRRR